MKFNFRVICFILLLTFFKQSAAQVIVNGYAQATGITGNTINVSNVNETYDTFEDGEKIIVIQMQDNVIGDTSNSVTFGDISTIKSAGLYEVATILSHTETAGVVTSITISASFTNTYNIGANSSVQLISYPTLGSPNYTTSADIKGLVWDGNIGGVIAFEVNGTLNLNNNINADGIGFRGGPKSAIYGDWTNGCDEFIFKDIPRYYGGKGEGIYKNTAPQWNNARGKILNGGGGGNEYNAGGGGGGGFTKGGEGGPGYGCFNAPAGVGGKGGIALLSYININAIRLYLGGGGGGGQHDTYSATDGVSGGGIIIIKANKIKTPFVCSGIQITANGNSNNIPSSIDGGGGGGAGGSIKIDCPVFDIVNSGCLTVTANGGKGGDCTYSSMVGAGGGGGQGSIIYPYCIPPIVFNNSFTLNGKGGGNDIANLSYAENGDSIDNLGIFYRPQPVSLFGNTIICNGNVTQFTDSSTTSSGTLTTWTWDFGDGSPVNNTTSPSHLYPGPGNYSADLIVSNSFGCVDTITKTVKVYYNPIAAFTNSNACFGEATYFTNTSTADTSTSITANLWMFGDNTPTSSLQNPNHYYGSSGTDTVTLITTTINGCSDTVSMNVAISPAPVAIANSNSPVAIGSSINLSTDTLSGIVWSGPNGFTSTLQNPVITNAQMIDSGMYQVIKTNSFGCTDTAEILVTVYQPEIPDNGIDDDGDGLIDCADPDLATLQQCYKCGYDSIAWQTVIPEPGFNKGIAIKYTGNDQHFTVPAGVTSIKIKAWGAGGGGSSYNSQNAGGGAGAYVAGNLAVTPATIFSVMVGEGGVCDGNTDVTSYGFGGSFSSLNYGGFGGGLSGFFTGIAFVNQTDQARALLLAGGGGGAERAAPNAYCTSGGQGGDIVFGGGSSNMQGENGGAKIGGGGGGGYNGGLMTLRLSGNGIYYGGEGGTSSLHSSVTSGLSLSSADYGNWNAFPLMYMNPPNINDIHYKPWVSSANPGIGTGNMYVGSKGGNGLVVIQWYEPIDDLIITASKDSICKGDTLTLVANGQSNYLWSPASTLSSDTAKIVIAAPTADITYQVISDYNNCKDTAQINIVVHPLPNLLLSPDSSICIGNSLQLNVSGAATYSWFPGVGLDTTLGASVTASPLVTAQYYVTGIDINNCLNIDSLKITVDSLPIASITGISGICMGDSTILTASGGGAYLWNTGATSTAIKIAPSSTTTYFVIVKNSTNCLDSAVFNVVVHPLPSVQFLTTNVCDGSNAVFTDLSTINPPDTIQSYTWNFGDGSASNSTQNPSHLFTADSSYAVQLLTVSNFGCSDSVIRVIVVNPNPTINFAANDTVGCELLCVSFQDLSTLNTGNNIQWLWGFGDGTATSTIENPTHCYTNNSSPLSYMVTLTVTSDSGCISTLSKNNYITVNPNPIAQFSTANVCEGTSVQVNDLSTIPPNETIQSYVWNFGDGSSVNTNQSVPGGHLYASANSYNLALVVVSNSGCIDSITKPVVVNPNPDVSFKASDTLGCEPLCISFQNFSTILTGLNVQWAWNVGDGSTINNSQTFDHCYTNDSLYAPNFFTVTLAVTSDSGCVSSLTKNNYIVVYPAPDASFTVHPQTAVITDPVISISDLSTGANFWTWNFGDPQSLVLDTSSDFNPGPHAYSDTGTYTITLITTTQYNCIDTTYETIIIDPDFLFYIPNAFTPDGDGVNDGFTGKGVFIKEFEMTIFDRWGNLIYSSTDINKPWDGKANHGTEIAQSDVYVYVFKVTDFKMIKHKYKGIVTLVR